VPVPRDPVVPFVEEALEAPLLDPLHKPVAGHGLDLDLGHDAEHADRHLGGGEQVGRRPVDHDHLAPAVDQTARPQRRREALQADARPVRGRADRAGDPLGVDVALIAQREAGLPERVAEGADRRSGQRPHPAGRGVDVRDAAQVGEVDQGPVGQVHRREGVPGRDDAHALPGRDRLADGGLHLRLARRRAPPRRRAALVPHPVHKRRAHLRLRMYLRPGDIRP
jgi:hypothetical protein